jgi:hypothetical protein
VPKITPSDGIAQFEVSSWQMSVSPADNALKLLFVKCQMVVDRMALFVHRVNGYCQSSSV